MPNKSGNAYGLTTLCPLRNDGQQDQSCAAITVLLSNGRVTIPWAQSVVATILIYVTWLSALPAVIENDARVRD